MFKVRLAGNQLYGKLLFTRLSLVTSLMVSFMLSFFPRDTLDKIWVLIESVAEGFPTFLFHCTQPFIISFTSTEILLKKR